MTLTARHLLRAGATLLLLGLLVLGFLFVLSGCAVGRELDTGAPMLGIRPDNSIVAAAGGIGGAIGGLIGGPAGAVAGSSILTGIAGLLFGAKRGSDKGWDQATEHYVGKPALAPARPDPVGVVPGPPPVVAVAGQTT